MSQRDEAVFSYSGCLSFDGEGNVTLPVDDFNRLLGRDGYACRLELDIGKVRSDLAKAEADLAALRVEVNAARDHAAESYSEGFKAAQRDAQAECERLTRELGEVVEARHLACLCGIKVTAQREEAQRERDAAKAECERVKSEALTDLSMAEQHRRDLDNATAMIGRLKSELDAAIARERTMREALDDLLSCAGSRGYCGDHWVVTFQIREDSVEKARAALAVPTGEGCEECGRLRRGFDRLRSCVEWLMKESKARIDAFAPALDSSNVFTVCGMAIGEADDIARAALAHAEGETHEEVKRG